MQKYKVKENCRVEHDNQKYGAGEVLELSAELALFHAPNIEVVKDIVAAKKAPIIGRSEMSASIAAKEDA